MTGAQAEVDYVHSSFAVGAPPYDYGDTGYLPVEQSISYLASPGGALVREVLEDWSDPYSILLRQVQLGGGTATASAQTWCYNSEGLVTQHDEFDFGQGAAALPSCLPSGTNATAGADLRRTLTTYAGFDSSLGIFDRPSSVQIVNPASQSVAAWTPFTTARGSLIL